MTGDPLIEVGIAADGAGEGGGGRDRWARVQVGVGLAQECDLLMGSGWIPWIASGFDLGMMGGTDSSGRCGVSRGVP